MVRNEIVAVVASRQDNLAAALVGRLRDMDLTVVEYGPHELCGRQVVVHSQRFELQGSPVASVLWRVPCGTPMSAGFIVEDQAFADSEVIAAWLCALRQPRIYAVNRLSASVWYGGGHWPAWRTWLRDRGLPVSRLHLGEPADAAHGWYPFLSGDRRVLPDPAAATAMGIATSTASLFSSAIVVAGQILGSCSRSARAVGQALTDSGIALARLVLDETDGVVDIDTMPDFAPGEELESVLEPLVEAIHDHLHPR